ncbi:hypothetical protein [Nocardia sp. N2S4-5]|uniref:hypothetical protein n=1 Tax=Nocardia sp. N2S4-5 TaxID=3351565 RepID=UPI0037D73B24
MNSALSTQLGEAAARAGLGGHRGTYLPTKIDNSGSTAGLVIAAVCSSPARWRRCRPGSRCPSATSG